MSTHTHPSDLVEVYRTNGLLEADRAIVEVLQPENITCTRRDRLSHALPAPDSQPGAYFIAVPTADAARARDLLTQALSDHVLDAAEGEVMF